MVIIGLCCKLKMGLKVQYDLENIESFNLPMAKLQTKHVMDKHKDVNKKS